MQSQELNYILGKILDAYNDASDLNFTVGKSMQVERSGELITIDPNIFPGILTPYQTEMIALNLMNNDARLLKTLLLHGACDLSYSVPGKGRFRVNVFSKGGSYSVVMRKLEMHIPTVKDLNLPEVFLDVAKERNGIVFVTGATGMGKSTTLAAILNEINETKAVHVITLEDPVEYQHLQKKATFNQREMGIDFDSYSNGLKAALRQAPKVILVGEMRDYETCETALRAAETGHLVMSTLHSIDVASSINRLLGMFPVSEESQVRIRVSDTLRWVISQRLVPRVGGGRVAAFEIMRTNMRVRELILKGETQDKTFQSIMEAGTAFGMVTFDFYLAKLYQRGLISDEIAMSYASHKGNAGRLIDQVKNARGETTHYADMDKLEIDFR